MQNDLYLEHKFHTELMPDKCSECYKEDKELTEDKRFEEAEQAIRSDYEINIGYEPSEPDYSNENY